MCSSFHTNAWCMSWNIVLPKFLSHIIALRLLSGLFGPTSAAVCRFTCMFPEIAALVRNSLLYLQHLLVLWLMASCYDSLYISALDLHGLSEALWEWNFTESMWEHWSMFFHSLFMNILCWNVCFSCGWMHTSWWVTLPRIMHFMSFWMINILWALGNQSIFEFFCFWFFWFWSHLHWGTE